MYFMALFSFSPNHTPKTGTMLEYGLFFLGGGGGVLIFLWKVSSSRWEWHALFPTIKQSFSLAGDTIKNLIIVARFLTLFSCLGINGAISNL